MKIRNHKRQGIQKRLVSALKYFRILNRLTSNEITEKTGINFYLLESGKRPVTLSAIIRLESVFGTNAVSNLLNRAWDEKGDWNEEKIKERIRIEQTEWSNEKNLRKENRNKNLP